MFVTRVWHVVARSEELGGKPFSRTVCNQPIAFFRNEKGEARAVSAVCPHRGVDLGQGRVIGSALQCPFHGLEFAGDGRCVRIPSQTADKSIPKHLRVPVYPVTEQQGLLWVWPEADGTAEGLPPRYDFLDPAIMPRAYHQAPMTFPSSYLNAMENALDGGHLAFVHTTSLPGAPEISRPYDLKMSDDGNGFSGTLTAVDPTVPVGVAYQQQKRKLSLKRLGNAMLKPFFAASPLKSSSFFYDLNGVVYFDNAYVDGTSEFIYSFFSPSDETTTLAVSGHVRNRAMNWVADAFVKKFMDVIMDEDKQMLAHMTPIARGAGGLPRPALLKADYTSAPFRRIYGNALRREGKVPPWLMGQPNQAEEAEIA